MQKCNKLFKLINCYLMIFSLNSLTIALESLNDDLINLHASIDNLKQLISLPYHELEKQIIVAERLYNTTQLLRKIHRFLQLHRQLKEVSEPSNQASIIFELDPLVNDKDLMKIEILIDERASVINSKQKLLHIANRDLINAIQDNNEEVIVKCLEIYRNLETLNTFLDNQIESYINDIKNSIKQCFNGADLATLQKTSIKSSPSSNISKLPGKQLQLTTSMNFKNKLLTALEWLFTDELLTYCEQIILLNKCLKKVTSGNITDNPSKDFLHKFSKAICEMLKTSFETSQVHVLQHLQSSLPKLLSFFNALHDKIGKDVDLNKSIFSSLNSGYIEKCAQNLKVPSSESFNEDIIDNMIKNAALELTVSIIDEDLLNSVVNILCACNTDFFNKIKSNIKTGEEAEQVLSIPNASQLQNINNINLIFHHQQKSEQMLLNIDLQKCNRMAYNRVKKSVDEGKSITMIILRKLTKQMMEKISIILLSMHREPSLNSDTLKVTATSMYLKELQDFISRSWTSHMSPFTDKSSVLQCAKELSIKTIELFIQNLSILRPISMKGRERMKSDCAQLETLIQSTIIDLSLLGNSYRQLRAISSLIIEKPEKLIESNLPSHIILFMLFGHAVNEDLRSPHRSANWSDEQLIKWLEVHKEREILELIAGALQKYRNQVRKENKSQYDAVYPLISSMLEKCLSACPLPPPARGLL